MSIESLLKERGATHGSFADNARASQALKRALLSTQTAQLTELHYEGLDQIVMKVSRIITGDPDNVDSWDDISGYAQCVARELRKSTADKPVTREEEWKITRALCS